MRVVWIPLNNVQVIEAWSIAMAYGDQKIVYGFSPVCTCIGRTETQVVSEVLLRHKPPDLGKMCDFGKPTAVLPTAIPAGQVMKAAF
jgi:hypothetical protein